MRGLTTIGLLFFSLTLAAQSQTSYQYLFNPLPINPAFTGYFDILSATAQSRFQSVGVDGAPNSQVVGLHSPIGSQAAAGIQVWNESVSVNQSTGLFGSYAYRINTGKFQIAAGLQAGIALNKTSFSTLNTRQGNDPVFTENIQSFQPNVGIGVLLHNEKIYLGISVPRLLDESSSYNQTSQYLAVAGYTFTINPRLKLQPNALVRLSKDELNEVIFNATLTIREVLGVGMSYQLNQSVAALLQLRLTDQVRFGYALESDAFNQFAANAASHEVSLHYLFRSKRKKAFSPRYF